MKKNIAPALKFFHSVPLMIRRNNQLMRGLDGIKKCTGLYTNGKRVYSEL